MILKTTCDKDIRLIYIYTQDETVKAESSESSSITWFRIRPKFFNEVYSMTCFSENVFYLEMYISTNFQKLSSGYINTSDTIIFTFLTNPYKNLMKFYNKIDS